MFKSVKRLHEMRRLFGTVAVLVCASAAIAGPLQPCFRAVSSASGSFLVITDAEYPHALPAMAERVTLQVVQGTTHKVFSSNKYWGDFSGWSVRLTKGESCPLSLISDDGNFLILLRTFDSALRIYRRPEDGQNGVLVRDIALKEIWPEHKWQEWRDMVMTDDSPLWFKGGTFEFSSDSRVLIHKTRWGIRCTSIYRMAPFPLNNSSDWRNISISPTTEWSVVSANA
jgi:hypothetical protein